MLDMNLIRENPNLVRENLKKKHQEHKLSLVDEVIALDAEYRATKTKADDLRGQRNRLSKEIGQLMGQGKKAEAEAVAAQKAAEEAQKTA